MSIIFNKQKSSNTKKRKSTFSIFKRPGGNKKVNRRVVEHKVKTTIHKLFIFLIFILIIVFIGSAVYFALKFTANVKSQSWNKYNVEEVIGLENIPTYPNSEYVFKSIDDEYVRKFVSLGRSIYRLPPKVTLNEVYKYYNDELTKLGWEYVDTVPLESEEKRYGQYWIKEGKGLRISNKINDIWYETLTEQEARTGLSDSVKKEAELKLLLLTKEYEDLRPDYPWRLSVPTEYLITYYPTSMGNLLATRLSKMNSKEYVDIIPIGYTGSKSYDNQLDEYLKEYNKKNKTNIDVVSTIITTIIEEEAIKISLINDDQYMEGYVTQNKRNNVNYLFISSSTKNPMLNYVIEKVETVRSSYYEKD